MDTVKQQMITWLEAPRLEGIATKNVIELKWLRDVYDKQLSFQFKQTNMESTPTSYQVPMQDPDFDIFITTRRIKASSVSEIIEERLIQCVKDKCVCEVNVEQLGLVPNAVNQAKNESAHCGSRG